MVVHLVSFDIPYPANYGGVMVVYHQIRALKAFGVRIILHCFQYGARGPSPVLDALCEQVHYYPRSRAFRHQLSLQPFILRTRRNTRLLSRLAADPHPVLFEGMHSAAYINHPALRNKVRILRMHNIEWQYYRGLAAGAHALAEKAYCLLESARLKRYEPRVLKGASAVIALTSTDQAYFAQKHPRVVYIPPFHPNDKVEISPGSGSYALFHGKLSVPDNERAAIWLCQNVFAQLDIPFVIAGMDPGPALKRTLEHFPGVRLVSNPDEEEMVSLIRNAQVNLLFSFTAAGIKLKLLHALYRGRHCIANAPMLAGSELETLCHQADDPAAVREILIALMQSPFSKEEIRKRKNLLEARFSNHTSALRLAELVAQCNQTPLSKILETPEQT